MQLTEHFTLDEFTRSFTAIRLGIDNTPPEEVIENLKIVASGLERIRDYLTNKPIRISSGYRCPELNAIVKGSKESAHMTGWACDFTAKGAGNREIVRAIVGNGLKFDQLILEGVTPNNPDGGWVHISYAPAMRGELLTMSIANGKVTYKKGIKV